MQLIDNKEYFHRKPLINRERKITFVIGKDRLFPHCENISILEKASCVFVCTKTGLPHTSDRLPGCLSASGERSQLPI